MTKNSNKSSGKGNVQDIFNKVLGLLASLLLSVKINNLKGGGGGG
jgi:hypothetical protein